MDDTPDSRTNPIRLREAAWIGRLSTINKGINERDETAHTLSMHTMKCITHFNHSPNCWPYMTHHTENVKQDSLSKYKRVIINQNFKKTLSNTTLPH
jgi:hypothetical protein